MRGARIQIGLLLATLVLTWAGPAASKGCRLKVVEVRRDGLYLSKPKSCSLATGDRLRAMKKRAFELRVVATASRFVRAEASGGAAPAVGDRFRPAAPPGRPGAGGPAGQEVPYKAGPGARSEQLAEPFWRAAVAARVPQATAFRAVRSGAPAGFRYQGELGLGVQATLDRSDRDRGYLRTFVDSRLGLHWAGPVDLGYSHRLTWQRRLGYGFTAQPWEGDYPEWALREIRFDFSAFEDRLAVSLGRLAPRGVGGARAVDGAVLQGAPLQGLVLGAYGGMLPDPTSLEFASSGLGYGGFLRGQWAGRDLRVHGSLLVGGTTFEGQRDELAADALLGLRLGRWFDLTALSRLNLVGDHNPLDRPAADLTRLFVSATTRPTSWFDLGLHYNFYRWVPTKRSLAEWGDALTQNASPLNAAGLSAGFAPADGLRLVVEADLDLQPGWSRPGLWGGLLASYRFGDAGHRVGLGYRLHDSEALFAHHAEASVLLALLRQLELQLAYRFGRFEHVGPAVSVREHDLNLVLDWLIGWGLHAFVDASWLTGDDVQAVLILGRLGWRFR